MNKDTKSYAHLNRITYSWAMPRCLAPVLGEAIISAINNAGYYSNAAFALSGLAGSAAYSFIVAPTIRREGSASRLRNKVGVLTALAVTVTGMNFGGKLGSQLDTYIAQRTAEAKIDQACINAGGFVGQSDSEPLDRSCILKDGSVVKIRIRKLTPTP